MMHKMMLIVIPLQIVHVAKCRAAIVDVVVYHIIAKVAFKELFSILFAPIVHIDLTYPAILRLALISGSWLKTVVVDRILLQE